MRRNITRVCCCLQQPSNTTSLSPFGTQLVAIVGLRLRLAELQGYTQPRIEQQSCFPLPPLSRFPPLSYNLCRDALPFQPHFVAGGNYARTLGTRPDQVMSE